MNPIKPEDMAMEVGHRCRRVRMAQGLSQQQLADLAETTPQNISKYEKSGISDIFWIKKLSGILGTNLLDDETDREGTVGEVGKEILYTLIIRGGHENTYDILNAEMYGYSEERISREIFKLEKIGMVVREQFNGWTGFEEDITFITAKGLITLKNMQLNVHMEKEVFDMIGRIDTYEQIICGCNCYQEFIDKHPAEKLIRSIWYGDEYGVQSPIEGMIGISSDYRCNYIKWLKKNYLEGFEEDRISEVSSEDKWIPGRSIYHDIIYRMALGITDETEWLHACDDMDLVLNLYDDFDMLQNLLPQRMRKETKDIVKDLTDVWLTEEFGINDISSKEVLRDEETDPSNKYENLFKDAKEEREFFAVALNDLLQYKGGKLSKEEAEELGYDKIKDIDKIMGDITKYLNYYKCLSDLNYGKRLEYAYKSPSEIYKKVASEKQSVYPTEWFTTDEIKEFINLYFGSAQTDEEKELDQLLIQINKLMPDTLDYYRFPEEWEENGLADLIRKNHNVPKVDMADVDE